jgi:hypothetical protein
MWVAASWTRAPEERAHRAHRLRRAERGPQEADSVQVLEPLTVLDIGLPPRDILHVPCVHQADLQAAGLQDLIQGDPVHARGLHGHGSHAALLQPGGQRPQVRREGPEAPDGLRVAVQRHADVDLGGADVDARRVRGADRQGGSSGCARVASGHGVSLVRGKAMAGRRPRSCENGWYSSKRDGRQTDTLPSGASPVTCARDLAPR